MRNNNVNKTKAKIKGIRADIYCYKVGCMLLWDILTSHSVRRACKVNKNTWGHE